MTDKHKQRLSKDLKDKEYRDEYVSSSVDVGVAFQIRALRDQREWKQTELANRAKMHQVRISELENPSHSPTLKTLKRLANAFEVGLIVRFVPISEIVKHELNLGEARFEVPSFNEEDFFKEEPETEISSSSLIDEYYKKRPEGNKKTDGLRLINGGKTAKTEIKKRSSISSVLSASHQNRIPENINESAIG